MKKHTICGILILINAVLVHGQKNWHLDQTLDLSEDTFRLTNFVSNNNYIFVANHVKDLKDKSTGDPLMSAGAVYVYKLNTDGQYELAQRIFPPNPASEIRFGTYMEVSDKYFLSAAASGIYIYELSDGKWHYTHTLDYYEVYLQFPNIEFYDDYLLIGNPSAQLDENKENPIGVAGSVRIYKLNAGFFEELVTIVAPDRENTRQFGRQVEFDGELLLISALENGSANGMIFNYELTDGEFEPFYTHLNNDIDYFGNNIRLVNKELLVYSGNDGAFPDLQLNTYTYADNVKRWRPNNKVELNNAFHIFIANDKFAMLNKNFYSFDLEKEFDYIIEGSWSPLELNNSDRLFVEINDGTNDDKIGIYRYGYPLNVAIPSSLLISLYPNPANNQLNFKHDRGRLIEIYSIDGRLVLSQAYQNQLELEIPASWKGIYLLKSTDENGQTLNTTFVVK